MRKGSYSEELVKDVVDACDLHVDSCTRGRRQNPDSCKVPGTAREKKLNSIDEEAKMSVSRNWKRRGREHNF